MVNFNPTLTCYIVHYSKLTNRKKNMLKQLETSGLKDYCEIIWIDQFDRDVLTKEQINTFSRPDTISLPLIGNAMANEYAFLDIATKKKKGLIIDDDLIFNEDFVSKLDNILTTTNVYIWDLIFLATVCNIHGVNINPYHCGVSMNGNLMYNFDSKNVITTDTYTLFPSVSSRGGSGVLVNVNTAQKLLETIVPFSQPIDISYTTEILRHNLKCYFIEPVIAQQGSELMFDKSY